MPVARDVYLSFDPRTGVSLLALATALALAGPRPALGQACGSGADVTLSASCTGPFNWTGGNLVNIGTISGATSGVQAYPSNVGTLTNRGTIQGTTNGFDTDTSTVTITALVNSGTVNGGQDGVYLDNSSFGTISNTAFGTISGTRSGLYFTAYSAGAGIINNQGTITGGTYGLYNDTGGFGGTLSALNNSGTISATGGTGTAIYNSGIITALNNSGTIRGQLYAIDDQSSGGLGTITNSGTIAGNIRSAATLTINGAGGSAFGTLIGYDLSSAGLIDTSVIFGSGNIALGDNVTGTVTINGARVRISNTVNIGGAITLNGGVLDVAGTITGTPSVTVNGGVLMGAGTIDPVAVTIANGGTFSPGNGTPGTTTSIVGDLVFQSGATYQVHIGTSAASLASTTGTATLGGATVSAVVSGYVGKRYTILTATGGVIGTFTPTVAGLPPAFRAALAYDANNVYLDFTMALPNAGNLNGNQQSVGNAVLNSFNNNGSIPAAFGQLTPAGLTQIAGELSTRTQQTTIEAMSQFVGLLADPALGCSSLVRSDSSCPSIVRNVSTSAVAGPPGEACDGFSDRPCAAESRWSPWARAFSSAQSMSGDAVKGSNGATSTVAGMAIGADYLLAPTTLVGVAAAWAITGFNVESGGSGKSDLYQLGLYARQSMGPAYLAGGLGYGRQEVTTDRTVTVAGADHLQGKFGANAWSGRVEGGWRFASEALAGMGLTPYAAGQVTFFDTPAYSETVVSGRGDFALSYAARSTVAPRTEIGLRPDKAFALADGVFTLRGRLAWAHDFNTERSAVASFQALPGSSFVVNGATPAPDSVLVAASAEMKWNDGWSVAASFDGELSSSSRSFGAKGVVRYRW